MVFPWFSHGFPKPWVPQHPATRARPNVTLPSAAPQGSAAGRRPPRSPRPALLWTPAEVESLGVAPAVWPSVRKNIYINLHIFTCSIQIYLYLLLYIHTLYIYTLYIYTLYILLYGYADHNDSIMGYYHTYRNNESIDVMMFIRQHQEK